MDWKNQIHPESVPEHIAVIMDGNGRWAQQHNRPRIFGHKNGVKSVRDTTEGAAEIGVKYLTLYAFSTENWNRPRLEVNALMGLLLETLQKELTTLLKNSIRLKAIGDIDGLPERTRNALREVIEQTASNDKMDLVLALNYSGRWDLMNAVRQIGCAVKNGQLDPDSVTEETVSGYLSTAGMPDPELLIRTSGEHRVSNFLLWESAYTEFYFTDCYWPDFRREHLFEAIVNYQNRERRFGGIGQKVH